MIRRFQALALAALLAIPAGVAAQDSTTVILVRHAEKVTTDPRDPNPALSPAGEARARELAHLLQGRHVSAAITTQLARTRLTAQPTADAAHVTIEEVPIARDMQAHVAAVAELVRTGHAGQTVLVVGHSNTVTKILAALGGPTLGDFCDSAYGNLLTLVIPASGPPRLTRGHYGAADPNSEAGCVNGIMEPQPAAP
jgi:broad specificity phosphatase PhoE